LEYCQKAEISVQVHAWLWTHGRHEGACESVKAASANK
jgi:hypothetical protein